MWISGVIQVLACLILNDVIIISSLNSNVLHEILRVLLFTHYQNMKFYKLLFFLMSCILFLGRLLFYTTLIIH